MGKQIFGDKQLSDLFDKLRDSQKRSIVISAFRKASKPMLTRIKANLIARTKAKSSGNLAKSLGYRPVRGQSILHLGARRYGNFKGFHSHIIESGTGQRYYTTQRGAIHATGKVHGRYWFRTGVESTQKQVMERFMDAAVDSFAKLIQRANAKRKT